jgi:hypothetical protein
MERNPEMIWGSAGASAKSKSQREKESLKAGPKEKRKDKVSRANRGTLGN